ncbi:MAG: carboxypeptidase regulatory-like domain-containing protein [Bryobacteraceae bacterium]
MSVRFVLAFTMVWISALHAQTGMGNIQGTVKDTTGAVVPGARVTVTHRDTARQYNTVTNETGFYLVPSVQMGAYSIAADASGMETWKADFTLQTGQTAEINPVLKVGATSTEITVAGDVSPLVTTTAPTLANVVERARIEQLPLSGRFFQSLVAMTTPGMEGAAAAPLLWGLRWATEFMQDGAVLANRETGEIMGRPPGLDTVQEFRAETNNSSAKMNRPGSVIVNTRAGTNKFHGAAFETAKNNGFGLARKRQDYYEKPPHLVRNEFGVSGGGPLWIPKVYNGKNKTFFFAAFEAFRSVTSPTISTSMPTLAMREGDFSGLIDGQGRRTTLYDPWTTDAKWSRQPFPNNQIPVSRRSLLAAYIYQITPAPSLPAVNPMVADNWFGPSLNNRMEDTITSRFDHRLSDRDQLFVRYSHGYRQGTLQQGAGPITLDKLANGNSQNFQDDSGVFSWTHTFSPTFFSETLVNGSSEDNVLFPIGQGINVADKLGLPNPFKETAFPQLTSVGFGMTYRPGINARNYLIRVYNVDENLTKIRGRHELQFGGRFRHEMLNSLPDQQQVMGAHAFGSLATALYDPTSGNTLAALPRTGHDAANLFLGVAGTYSAQFVRKWYRNYNREYALYLQDNFKLSSRLTLNLGVRWEFYPFIREQNNVLTGFDEKTKAIVNGAPLETMYRVQATMPSIVKAFTDIGVRFESPQEAGLPDRLVRSNPLDFGPRAGFAYRLGEGRRAAVVRGGYALFGYPMPTFQFDQRMRANPPTTAQFSKMLNAATQSPDGLRNYGLRSVPTVVAGVNSKDVIDLSKPGGIDRGNFSVVYFDPDQPTSRAHQWNLTLEREFLDNDVVRVGYVGTHGARLDQYYTYNEGPNAFIWYTTTGLPLPTGPYAGVANRPFENTVLGSIERYQKTGWSNANAFQVEVQRRYAKGYAFQVFYVMTNAFRAGGRGWQDDMIPTTSVFLPGAVPEDINARNRFLNYRRDTDVQKHRLRWNWIVDLPFGRGKRFGANANGFWNRVIGGWQLAGNGNLNSRYFALPTSYYAVGKVEIYGKKYPIQDCRSGVCYDGYLFWNGYIPANRINSYDPKTGRPNGVMGVPANYVPAARPLNPTPADGGNPADPMYPYYDSNSVMVPMKSGAMQRIDYNPNLNPWRNQFVLGPMTWNMSASAFKAIRINERFTLRINMDFFSVLNMPGTTMPGGNGIISNQLSNNEPRNLQMTMRLQW